MLHTKRKIQLSVTYIARACVSSSDTWAALRILFRIAIFLRSAARTSIVFHAFRAAVIVGVERAAGASFAFRRISIVGGHEFLARSALCDWHQERSPFALATHL